MDRFMHPDRKPRKAQSKHTRRYTLAAEGLLYGPVVQSFLTNPTPARAGDVTCYSYVNQLC